MRIKNLEFRIENEEGGQRFYLNKRPPSAFSILNSQFSILNSSSIRQWGLELGFDRVGFARAERLDAEGVRFEEWLAAGRHGSMAWLARDPARRIDPQEILPGARSVIVVAKNYYTPIEHSDSPEHGKVSRYAWGRDYHRILPKKLKKLHRLIIEHLDPEAENRWYVDAGPPMEKAWAVRAGLGWMGKHTNVITRTHGSWVFLGVMFTTLEIEPDDPIPDFCGSCTRCIDACPTDAITAPYELDARRCISYLTIELPGTSRFRPNIVIRWKAGSSAATSARMSARGTDSSNRPTRMTSSPVPGAST